MTYVNYTNPILHEEIPDYNFDTDEPYNEVKLVNEMIDMEFMSLTAPEIGDRVRIMSIGDPMDFTTISILYNPRIITASEEQETMEEMIPAKKLAVKISRPKFLKIRFLDDKGVPHTKEFAGLTARLLHRSVRQLDGINSYNDATPEERLKSMNIIV